MTRLRGEEIPLSTLPTERELDVLMAVVRHEGQKGAAIELGISGQTVKNHISRLCARTGATTTIGILLRLGWLQMPSEGECRSLVAMRKAAIVAERLRLARDEADALLDELEPVARLEAIA